jgi:hypothetical protein
MARGGKSRATTIVEVFVDGLLLLCFIAQAFILGCMIAYGDMPLPTKWLSRTISERLPPGFSVQAEHYSLTFDGTIEMENISLHLDGIEHAVLDADYAHLEFGIDWPRNKGFHLKECVLSDGRLSLPAVYSPSGKHSTILEQIALRIVPVEGGLGVDSFAARHEDIRLRGRIDWVFGRDVQESVDLRANADRLFSRIADILKQKPRFDGLAKPTIFFRIDSGKDRSLSIDSRVSSRAFQNDHITAENLTFDTRLSLTDQTLVTESSILLKADAVEIPQYKTRAAYLSALVQRDEWEALLKGEWPSVEVVAEALEIEGVPLKSPRIKLSPRAFPEISFEGLTSGLQGAVQFNGSFNTQTRAAYLQAAGSIDLLAITPEKIKQRLPTLNPVQAPYYNLNLDLDEGLTLKEATLRARVDALDIEGLTFDHIRFKSRYSGGTYSIDRLYLRRDRQWLDLGFQLDSATKEYALTLKGFAKPYDYNALLPRWWGAIFEDFDFEQMESGLGDFAIRGNTEAKAADFFFGHVRASNVAYKGVHVDGGELIVRGRGPYAEIHDLDVRSGEGFARGTIRFASRLDAVRGPMSIRLDLDTKLSLSDAKQLFDENIASVLSEFATEALPRTTLKGAIFNKAYPEFKGLSHIDITADCPAPLRYRGIPLDDLRFDLIGRSDVVYLRDIRFGYAGGKAEAEADILTAGDSPAEARFQLSLNNARQNQAIQQLRQIDGNRDSPSDGLSEGRLDFVLHGRGPVNAPLKARGFGSFQIENDALYAIQLFGPLSKLLQNTRLGFTSFALDEMKGRFAMEDGTVAFQELEINGPRTRIEAPGTMQLGDLSLDMRVSVYLFGNAGNPDSRIRKFGDMITRSIPNLLEFELTGTPKDQNWRSLYDPRKFIPLL